MSFVFDFKIYFIRCVNGLMIFINKLVKYEIGVDYFKKNTFTSNSSENVPYVIYIHV